MKNKNRAKKKRSKPSNIEQATGSIAAAEIASSINIEDKPTTKAPRTNTPATGTPSMLYNAQNTHISGGSFVITTNNDASYRPSLDVLYKRVASNAILNAGGRADEVRCHPGTREEVISRIEKWGDSQDSQTPPIFWLSGPAGAGKSAIMQTVAERCKERGTPHANFFFFRGDPSRSHASHFIATLVHQIILLYPSLRGPVATMFFTNPFLLDSTLEDQVEQLIVTPLRSIPQSPSAYHPLLLLIDGLDECDSETKRSQGQILRAFDKVLGQYAKLCPLRVLVASRDEAQIQMAFNKLSSQCLRLYLNEEYSPENDIRVFVNAEFAEVRKTHCLAHLIDANWPSADDIEYIVEKSSGHFIYAATVMRFILCSSASPVLSLERVRGITVSTKSPFSHLDAIYTYILSQVDDQDALKDILSARILFKAVEAVNSTLRNDRLDAYFPQAKATLMGLLGRFNQKYTPDIIHSHLGDLTPLMIYQSQSSQLVLYHASMFDYLLDQSRSGDYFVDTAAFSYKILPELWKTCNSDYHLKSWALFGLSVLSQLQTLPPGFMSSVTPWMRKMYPIWTSRELLRILTIIYDLCTCDDDITNCRHALRLCINEDAIANGNITVNWNISPVRGPYSLDDMKTVPFGDRYFHMARADRGDSPDPSMIAALRPQSDFDRQESASWLTELLRRTDKIYPSSLRHRSLFPTIRPANNERYRDYWISWARSNGIPCEGLDDFITAHAHGSI